jgi:hypothetical protein
LNKVGENQWGINEEGKKWEKGLKKIWINQKTINIFEYYFD